MNRGIICLVCAGALLTLATSQAAAVVSNSGFEEKLSNWERSGAARSVKNVNGGVLAATEGNRQALMLTNRFQNRRRHKRRFRSSPVEKLQSFLGVPDLSALVGEKVNDGTAIKQNINLSEAQDLSFDFAFGHSAKFDANPAGDDVAFVMIDGNMQILTDLASTVFTTQGRGRRKRFQVSDYSNFVLQNLEAGDHELVFGVLNLSDGKGRSQLLVDNILLSEATGTGDEGDGDGNGEVIPEPVTAGLIALGLGGIGFATRRRRSEIE